MTYATNDADLHSVLRQISAQDFLQVGMNEVAYIRPIIQDEEMEISFAVHAANGTRLLTINTLEGALAIMRENSLIPMTVH